MDSMHINYAESYTGPFQWSEPVLKSHIRKAHQNYNDRDPRTWPMIESIDRFPVKEVRSYDVPWNVAYKHCALMRCCKDKGAHLGAAADMHTDPDRAMDINWRFLRYPFNFTASGAIRPGTYIPKEEFEEWMTFVNGADWASELTPNESNIGESPKGKAAPASTNASSTAATYDCIMTLLDEQTEATTRITSLQNDLDRTQTLLAEKESKLTDAYSAALKSDFFLVTRTQELEDAEKSFMQYKQDSEHKMETLQQERDATRKQADEVKDGLKNEEIARSCDMRSAAEAIAVLEHDRDVACKSAKEAKERLEKILERMQTVAGKRKADDQFSGEPMKRSRAE